MPFILRIRELYDGTPYFCTIGKLGAICWPRWEQNILIGFMEYDFIIGRDLASSSLEYIHHSTEEDRWAILLFWTRGIAQTGTEILRYPIASRSSNRDYVTVQRELATSHITCQLNEVLAKGPFTVGGC